MNFWMVICIVLCVAMIAYTVGYCYKTKRDIQTDHLNAVNTLLEEKLKLYTEGLPHLDKLTKVW